MPCLKTWMCAGQFIGFNAISSALPVITGLPSSVEGTSSGTTNMFARNFAQWPERTHKSESISCGVLISL